MGGPVGVDAPVPVSEMAVAPGTKPVPVTVTDRLEPGVPDDGEIDVAKGGTEYTVNPGPVTVPPAAEMDTKYPPPGNEVGIDNIPVSDELLVTFMFVIFVE